MPTFEFGDLQEDNKEDLIVRLKSKNEKIKFRLVPNKFYFTAKHFIKEDGGWNVVDCPRVLSGDECEYCEKTQMLYDDLKKAEAENDEANVKLFNEEIRKYKVSYNFFYPIVDRDTETAKILQVSKSVRISLEDEYKNGTDMFKYDWILTRTERPGSDYYKLTRVDSSETKPLSEKEKKEYEKARKWNLEKLVGGKPSNQEFEEIEVDEIEKLVEDDGEKPPF